MSDELEYRGRVTNKRQVKDIAEDYEMSCTLLQDGHTWEEIADFINDYREGKYTITAKALSVAYHNRLKKEAISKVTEYELERLIDNLEAVMLKCMRQFNASIGEQRTVVDRGWVDKNTGKIKTPYRVVTKMQAAGAQTYLTIYLKALEQWAKYKDLANADKFDVNLFIKDLTIDDSHAPNMTPIQSEKEAKEYGAKL